MNSPEQTHMFWIISFWMSCEMYRATSYHDKDMTREWQAVSRSSQLPSSSFPWVWKHWIPILCSLLWTRAFTWKTVRLQTQAHSLVQAAHFSKRRLYAPGVPISWGRAAEDFRLLRGTDTRHRPTSGTDTGEGSPAAPRKDSENLSFCTTLVKQFFPQREGERWWKKWFQIHLPNRKEEVSQPGGQAMQGPVVTRHSSKWMGLVSSAI